MYKLSIAHGTLFLILVFGACGTDVLESLDESSTTSDAVLAPDVVESLDGTTPSSETPTADVTDIVDSSDVTIEADSVTRTYSHRAIGGVSMGAAAARIAVQHPELFDVAGALGGYISLRYLVSMGQRLQLAGFCPLEQLESNVGQLNDISAEPSTFCGPANPLYELEYEQDFNHFHHSTQGANFNRGFYIDVFKALSLGFGNFATEPYASSPYLPRGVEPSWYQSTSSSARCNNPPPVPQVDSYNAEYNPNGSYPVIPFCDSDKRKLSGLLGADFDPTVTHTRPTDILLAVDINGNGIRDYGEPVFLNSQERYDDTGVDGCTNAFEDGLGGCLEGPNDPITGDPNGDDYHWYNNPLGTENNDTWDVGELYTDYGLDGVAATGDPGEDNGTFDQNSAYERTLTADVPHLISQLSDEQIDSIDFYFDSGIRDALHAAVSTRQVVGALKSRGSETTYFQGIAGRSTALFPDTNIDDVINILGESDRFEPGTAGRNVYVEYGDQSASDELIEAGDGGHIGTTEQVLARLLVWYAFALHRFADPDLDPGGAFTPPIERSYYSTSFGARRNYTVVLPPGYDADTEKRYPVLYVLHGLGQTPAQFANVAILTSGMMSSGVLPKAIQVYVDGSCCRVRKDDHSVRECACGDSSDGQRPCIDPDCAGDHESCEVRNIDDSEYTSECIRASLYLDLITNRFGEPGSNMQYGSTILELLEHIDSTYRTRSANAD
jgi:hypothetical protein